MQYTNETALAGRITNAAEPGFLNSESTTSSIKTNVVARIQSDSNIATSIQASPRIEQMRADQKVFEKTKTSPELTTEITKTGIAKAVIEIRPDKLGQMNGALSKLGLPFMESVNFKQFGTMYVTTILRSDKAEKLAQLDFVKGIHYDRPTNQSYKFPVINLVRDYGIASIPRIRPYKMKEGQLTTEMTKKLLGGYEAEADGITGKGITIAACDSGIAMNKQFQIGEFEALSTIAKYQAIADHSGHGTWCTSCMCGRRVNIGDNYNVDGMCPDAKLVSIKALFTPVGMGTMSSTLKALSYALESKAKIINMSLGSSGATPLEDPQRTIIRKITEAGSIVVVSAGNSGQKEYTITSPGDIDEVITVGAQSYKDNYPAWFSSRGPTVDGLIKPDIVSFGGGRLNQADKPDENIVSSSAGLIDAMDGGFRVAGSEGTSMAAPHLSGVVGWWSQYYMMKLGVPLTTPIVKDIFKKQGHAKTNFDGYGLATYSWIKEYLR